MLHFFLTLSLQKVPLTYPVVDTKCNSKFNLRTKILTVTLPVLPPEQADNKDNAVNILTNKIWVGPMYPD